MLNWFMILPCVAVGVWCVKTFVQGICAYRLKKMLSRKIAEMRENPFTFEQDFRAMLPIMAYADEVMRKQFGCDSDFQEQIAEELCDLDEEQFA
jgi:hypothetical protein